MSTTEVKYTRKEKILYSAALSIVYEHSLEELGINTLSQRIMVSKDKIQSIYATDNILRFNTLKYAADIWSLGIRKRILQVNDNREKIKILIHDFAAGTIEYSDSLSSYIDAWKIIRDMRKCNSDEAGIYMRKLTDIYLVYVDLFISVFESIGVCNHECDIVSLAWIMVVISDGIHIQLSVLKNPINIDLIVEMLYTMVTSILLE